MSQQVDEILFGRKTFFIAPDSMILPQVYMEEYLARGYECYFIENDKILSIDKKVDVILGVFKDCIIFFCVDTTVPGINWFSLIETYSQKYPNAVLGVLFVKRKNDSEKEMLQRQYLFDLGLKGGCIQLEYQKKNNFSLIERTLFANQARGRRQNVRVITENNASYSFITKQGRLNGKINDISTTHFSVTFQPGESPFYIYEKIPDVMVIVDGVYVRSDVELFMIRETADGILHVFSFIDGKGQCGLDSRSQQLLVPKFYELLKVRTGAFLDLLFRSASKMTHAPSSVSSGASSAVLPENPLDPLPL